MTPQEQFTTFISWAYAPEGESCSVTPTSRHRHHPDASERRFCWRGSDE